MRALLLVLALLSAPLLPPATGADTQMDELCTGFRAICAFVARACDPSAADSALDARCVESFQLYYEHSHTLSSCPSIQATSGASGGEEVGGEEAAASVEAARAFLTRYSAWQTAHVCELFHAAEAKAARVCAPPVGADDATGEERRPWRREAWPLFCRSVFTTYRESRRELDALCARTRFSDAFWAAFAEFSGSDTCRRYYRDVRAAATGRCGDDKAESPACTALFEWYSAHQREIERDCLELRASKAFYRGFYHWKHAANPLH